ncbi:glutamate-1-semialdehyde-2,1-aminomutase [Alicyclobacillaceae bacterium I2511]|nr:glutamate-1-semialdehyde-2,1-aminomutase [Alicyclobacillaceae bacterium I2511]
MMGRVSNEAFAAAKKHLVGGVNSPVRAFGAVGGVPVFAQRGAGPYLYDIEGKQYVDYLLSWGPLIWGHAHPTIIASVMEAAQNGTSFGLPTVLETQMAALVCELVPSVELVRMVNSGTEATMSALRLARAYTGRDYIVKFEGCYHGHADSFLVKAGSGVATLGLPDSPGVPRGATETTLTAPYNDLNAVKELFLTRGEQIAAVIVEPVAGNMGCVLPKDEFLSGLRTLTQDYGALLIMDEVMTGFRVALGGGQERFNIHPDLTTMGKVIGGGLPVGAYGGRRQIMQRIAPEGTVYQAGTLSGNPLAMAAGLAALQMLKDGGKALYERLEFYGKQLVETFIAAGTKRGIPVFGHAIGGMFGLFFHEGPVFNYTQTSSANRKFYTLFFQSLLSQGVMLAPSQLESGFVSVVHGPAELAKTQEAIEGAMAIID